MFLGMPGRTGNVCSANYTRGVFNRGARASELADWTLLRKLEARGYSVSVSRTTDLVESGALGGQLFPSARIPTLVEYLDRRGVWLTEGVNGGFDGVRGGDDATA